MKEIIHTIYYPFAIDHGSGTLAEENDYDRHVVQLIKQVLFTNPGERINRPDFGCGLRRMVFTPNSEMTASMAQVTVYQALEQWLGDVISVDSVEVSSKNEILEVHINYLLKARRERRYLTFEVN